MRRESGFEPIQEEEKKEKEGPIEFGEGDWESPEATTETKQLKERLQAFWEGGKTVFNSYFEPLVMSGNMADDAPLTGPTAFNKFATRFPYLGSSAFMVAAMADNLTWKLRTQDGKQLFDGADKISDAFGEMWEPLLYQSGFKTAYNTVCEVLNRTVLKNKEKKIFYYSSFTRKDILFSMAWYGGLWVTSEFECLRPYHPFTYLGRNYTADKSDLAAYAVGFAGEAKIAKHFMSKFPPGRFADMERRVSINAQEYFARTPLPQLEPQTEKDPDAANSPQRLTAMHIREYRAFRSVVDGALRETSADVRGYIGKDPELVDGYEKFIVEYGKVLARKLLTEKYFEAYQGAITPEGTDQANDKLARKAEKLRNTARDYRDKTLTSNTGMK